MFAAGAFGTLYFAQGPPGVIGEPIEGFVVDYTPNGKTYTATANSRWLGDDLRPNGRGLAGDGNVRTLTATGNAKGVG